MISDIDITTSTSHHRGVSRRDTPTAQQAAALTLMRADDPDGDVSLVRVPLRNGRDEIWTTAEARDRPVKEIDGGPARSDRVTHACVMAMASRGWVDVLGRGDIAVVTDSAADALRRYRDADKPDRIAETE